MFTGIVTHIGRIVERSGSSDVIFTVESDLDLATIDIGASVCHNGVCMTVIAKSGAIHRISASAETLERSTTGGWSVGDRVNLERSLRLGDELGGHIVFGHVDGIGRIETIEPVGDSHKVEVSLPTGLEGLVAEKGSISIDGISLTVNAVGERRVELMIIPHTWQHTTLADRKVGDPVNVEADMLARYVARQIQLGRS